MTQAVEERTTKRPRIEVQSSTIELTTSLANSGKILAKLQIPSESSVAQLKRYLEEHIEAGTVVKKLFKGETLLEDKRSLEASGLANGAEINAIVGSKPILFLSKGLSEDMTFNWSDSENEGGSDDEDSYTPAVVRKVMEEAPTVAREVAMAMMAAAPRLGEVSMEGEMWATGMAVDGSREDVPIGSGQVIVIGHQGLAWLAEDPKKACLEVFQQCRARRERRAECREEDWSKHLRGGFIRKACGNFPDDEDDIPGDVGDKGEILAITRIMSEKLDKHFSFSFFHDDNPIFNGGYSSDGSIVGFLGCAPT